MANASQRTGARVAVLRAPAEWLPAFAGNFRGRLPGEREIDASDFEPKVSLRLPAIVGLAAILIGFGGFMVWALTVSLDSAAVASGSVIVDSKRKTVSHLEGGILKKVLVAEGDVVKEGQPLIELDDTRALADFTALDGSRIGLVARLARLRAEQHEEASVTFPPELLADASPIAASVIADERLLFQKRHDIYNGKLAAQENQITQFEAEAQAFAAQATAAGEQKAILTDQLDNIRKLVARGVVPARQASDLQGLLSQATGDAGEYAAQQAKAEQGKASAELALLSAKMDWQGDIATDIQDTQLKLNQTEQQVAAAKDVLGRLIVRAPQEGTVLNIQVRTPGSAIGAGQPLLDIEPGEEPMIIEARLSPLDIDAVHVGGPVQARLTAYNYRTHPPLDGHLTYIAAGQTEDTDRGLVYYTVRAAIDPAELAAHPSMKLYPGMPVDLVIKREARKAIDYIIQPIAESFYRAFREE
jgi:HlyD family secretion protein